MKYTSVLLLLILSATGFNMHGGIPTNRLCIKWSPLSLIEPYAGPSLRASIEYKIKNNVSLENEFGFFFSYPKGSTVGMDSKGYVGTLEWKYYTESESKTTGPYVSTELFFKNQSYNTSDSFGTILKEYRVTKNVECLTFKFGNMIVYNSGIIVEGYFGLGIRFQQNTNTLSFEENEYMPHTLDYNINIILNQAHNRVYPNFVAGFKIGFRILK